MSINQYPEWIKCNELNALQSREIIALKERIKRLEDRIDRASKAFFADCPDEDALSKMLAILEEERNKP